MPRNASLIAPMCGFMLSEPSTMIVSRCRSGDSARHGCWHTTAPRLASVAHGWLLMIWLSTAGEQETTDSPFARRALVTSPEATYFLARKFLANMAFVNVSGLLERKRTVWLTSAVKFRSIKE